MNTLRYIWLIIASPSFAEQQAWVQKVAKACAIIPANGWTLSRILGAPVFIYLSETERSALALLSALLFALTDRVDGMVARAKNNSTSNGGLLDGVVDKIFILPILGYLVWIWSLPESWEIPTYLNLGLLVVSELSRVLMPLSSRFNLKEHAFAIYYGKAKFTVQVVIAVLLWIAVFALPWNWWPFWLNVLITLSTILSLASIIFRLYPELERYLADVVTLGNAICGSLAILSAFQREWTIFANLVALGAGLDAIDGALARKLKGSAKTTGLTFGAIADDIGDWITFALAPALALYFFDSKLAWVAGGYLGATTLRLAYFTWLAKKSRGESGVFRGLPSPAAAVGLASIFVWSPTPSASWLGWTAVLLGTLEVLFFLRWYHFKRIGGTARRDQLLTGIAGVVVFSAFGAGETLSFLASIYAFTFFRPVANWLWGWDQEKK